MMRGESVLRFLPETDTLADIDALYFVMNAIQARPVHGKG
jgi:hypothetical protein